VSTTKRITKLTKRELKKVGTRKEKISCAIDSAEETPTQSFVESLPTLDEIIIE